MKFIKGTKIITVKGTSKRVTHKRKIKVSNKKEISPIDRIKKIIPNVNLNGATNDQLNSIANGIEESIGKFSKIKINSIGWITSDDVFNYGKIDAAYVPKSRNNPESRIILNKDVMSNIESWSENAQEKFNSRKEVNISFYKDNIEQWKKFNDLERIVYNEEKLKNIIACSRLFITCEQKDKIKSIVVHECYHAIDDQMKLENIFLKQLKEMNVTEKDKMLVSDYAASQNAELWAETGTAMNGKINIPNSVKNAFKNTMETIQ